MRVVSDQPNEFRFFDPKSNSDLALYYRQPEPTEYAAYSTGMTKRTRNKVIPRIGANRQEWGKKVLEGWPEGYFGVEKKKKVTPVSSDPESKNYRSDWKEWFCKNNPDLVEDLAIFVFEGRTEVNDGRDLSEDDEGADTNPN